jgi:hypothetical protein
VAQRPVRWAALARRRHHSAVVGPGGGAAAGRARSRGTRHFDRRGRRRRAVARPCHGARRSHEARRRPCAAPADDGSDGTTGLRTMRIQLSGLFGRHLLAKGGATEPLRARWQRNHPHAQGAAPGPRQGPGVGRDAEQDPYACRCYGCTGRRAGMFARVPDRGALSVAHAPQQGGLREGDLAY